jgi:hypothetical protein
MQIDLSNVFVAEEDIEDTISRCCWTQCDRQSVERFTDDEDTISEVDLTLALHDANHIVRTVFDRWELVGKRSWADSVASRRGVHVQGLMGTFAVVRRTPSVEVPLAVDEVSERSALDEFCLQSSVEAFVLPRGLWVADTSVADVNAESDQPHRQCGVPIALSGSPRLPVVHQHPQGKSVVTEDRRQVLLHHGVRFSLAGEQSNSIARMIVKDGQRMTAFTTAVHQREVPLEIHLPEQVRCRSFEASPSGVLVRVLGSNASGPMQDRCDRAGTGNARMVSLVEKSLVNLSASPCLVRIPYTEDRTLQLQWRSAWTRMWTARAIFYSFDITTVLSVPTDPLIAGLGTDGKPPTELTDVCSVSCCQSDEFDALRHCCTLFPRHGQSPAVADGE